MIDYELKIKICALSDAFCRNITDNFRNISLQIDDNGYINVKVILDKVTNADRDYIDDASAEFSASQEFNIVNQFEITSDTRELPYDYIIYSRK